MLENTSKGMSFEHFRASPILRNARIIKSLDIIYWIVYVEAQRADPAVS